MSAALITHHGKGTLNMAVIETEDARVGVHATILPGDGFARHAATLAFPTMTKSLPEITIDEQWFGNAQLVVVRTTRVGHVVRPIEVPGVKACADKNGQC